MSSVIYTLGMHSRGKTSLSIGLARTMATIYRDASKERPSLWDRFGTYKVMADIGSSRDVLENLHIPGLGIGKQEPLYSQKYTVSVKRIQKTKVPAPLVHLLVAADAFQEEVDTYELRLVMKKCDGLSLVAIKGCWPSISLCSSINPTAYILTIVNLIKRRLDPIVQPVSQRSGTCTELVAHTPVRRTSAIALGTIWRIRYGRQCLGVGNVMYALIGATGGRDSRRGGAKCT